MADRLGLWNCFARRDFDFDLHAWVGKAGRDHGGRGPDVAEVLAQHRPTRLKIFDSGENITDPDYVGDAAAGIRQGLFNVQQALLRLRNHMLWNGHGCIIEAGGAGNEYPVSIHDGAGVPDLPFES